MKKCLFISCVASTIGSFNMNNIKMLKEMGYVVEVACDFQDHSVWSEERIKEFQNRLDEESVRWHQIDFSRNMLKIGGHIRSYRQLLNILKCESFDFVHCHTPIAAAIGRLAAKRSKTRVIYTAHGFHFFKGAPWKNWLLFYPVEKYLAPITDILITINQEDYARAQKRLQAKHIAYVPGVGVDTERIKNLTQGDFDWEEKKASLGIPTYARVLLSIGELNANKNHSTVIRALAKCKEEKLYYVICGQGAYKEKLQGIAKELGIEERVKLLGYRTDILELCRCSDIFVFPSFREGLPVSLMEAMVCGLPCIVSNIRGNQDLIVEDQGGRLVEPMDIEGFVVAIDGLLEDEEACDRMGSFNQEQVKAFDCEEVNERMQKIYKGIG